MPPASNRSAVQGPRPPQQRAVVEQFPSRLQAWATGISFLTNEIPDSGVRMRNRSLTLSSGFHDRSHENSNECGESRSRNPAQHSPLLAHTHTHTQVDTSREVLGSTQANYLAQVNVELMLASAQSNSSLNKLTVISTIFLPLNLVCVSMRVG